MTKWANMKELTNGSVLFAMVIYLIIGIIFGIIIGVVITGSNIPEPSILPKMLCPNNFTAYLNQTGLYCIK